MFITEDNKKTFRAIILLNEMINGNHQFKVDGIGDDKLLEALFTSLVTKGYVDKVGCDYRVAPKGKDVYNVFMRRYTEYLKVYDIFSYVDLEEGEFAFDQYFDFETDDEWIEFINDERFDDLRIAVAMFKKVDPAEIVFMSFINENRFDTASRGWQKNLMSDDIWKGIEDICRTAIKPEQVGEDAMLDMINQGSELMIRLLEEEKEQEEERNNSTTTTTTETIIEEETVEYYEPYYDPYYISPIWLVPLFLW